MSICDITGRQITSSQISAKVISARGVHECKRGGAPSGGGAGAARPEGASFGWQAGVTFSQADGPMNSFVDDGGLTWSNFSGANMNYSSTGGPNGQPAIDLVIDNVGSFGLATQATSTFGSLTEGTLCRVFSVYANVPYSNIICSGLDANFRGHGLLRGSSDGVTLTLRPHLFGSGVNNEYTLTPYSYGDTASNIITADTVAGTLGHYINGNLVTSDATNIGALSTAPMAITNDLYNSSAGKSDIMMSAYYYYPFVFDAGLVADFQAWVDDVYGS